jgi:hypothetical protein
MKYAIIFAATAAATESYGYGGYGGYGSKPNPPVVAPGYGKPPVTITTQHQAYPTCVSAGYGGKKCDKWEDHKYVSTVINDYNKKPVTVTKDQEYITVYHEKKTLTHYPTPVGGYGAAPTAAKNATGIWYELYELVHEVVYDHMGKNALPGYGGSGLCHKCDEYQPIHVKEYKGGKWSEENKDFNYGGKPENEVKTYGKPGVYTIPGKDVTVYSPAPYGKAPEPIVYHYDTKTVTIAKPNDHYTCTWTAGSYKPTKPAEYPSHATKTPSDNYGYGTPKKPEHDKPSYPVYPAKSTPAAYGTGYHAGKPTPPPHHPSKPVYGDHKPTPTPYHASKPSYPDHSKPSYPDHSKPSYPQHSQPSYPQHSQPSYPQHSQPSYPQHSQPSYPATPSKPASYPSGPSYGDKGHPASPAGSSYPAGPAHPAGPSYPAGPNHPAGPAHPSGPEHPPAGPSYPAGPNHPAGPAGPAHPSGPEHPPAGPSYPAGGNNGGHPSGPSYPSGGNNGGNNGNHGSAGGYGSSYNSYSKRSTIAERRQILV